MEREKEIEKVKEFAYLRYMLQKNGGQDAQVKERVRRTATVVKQVWNIGKRRF